MWTLLQDLRYTGRQLRLSPVFTLTAILTLALGIGATTAIFSLVHAVMLRSLPVIDPASLYRIGDTQDCCVQGGLQREGRWSLFSYGLYKQMEATPEFEQLAAFEARVERFGVRREASQEPAKPLFAEFVSGNYFTMFGINSFGGRMLTPSDDQRSAAPVAVMSYRAWQQNFGGDPSVIGSTFIVEGHAFTIVGIAPPGFFGDTLRSDPPQLWIPLQQEAMVHGTSALIDLKSTNWLRIIGRLKPGASLDGVAPRLTTILQQWIPESYKGTDIPADMLTKFLNEVRKQHVNIIPAGDGIGAMKADYAASLRILMAICCMVLLIACANIANLLLAKGTVRRQQTSVQLALGATRGRLVRQALTESLALSILGGLAGLIVAYGATKLILVLAFGHAQFIPISATPSLPVLAFAFTTALLTGVLFGTAPAWLATHANPAEALRGANRSTRDRSSLPQKTLVVLQAALSVVLLASAAMLTHSLRNLEHRDFGFDTRNRVEVAIDQPPASYSQERLQVLNRSLQDRLLRIPGVERASIAMYTPFTDNWGEGVIVEGHPAPQPGENNTASWDRIGAGFFEAVGQPVLRGRGIEEQDTATSQPIAVVNEAFVKRFFKNVDPIGKHFGMDLPEYAHSYEIVGVVRDAHYTAPQEDVLPMFFLPMTQATPFRQDVMKMIDTRSHFVGGAVLLYHGEIGELQPQLRQALAQVDPNLVLISVQTMDQQVAMNFDQQRAVAQLAGLFGIVALLLAAIGLYGVTAYTVARRTGEIGLRMALGSDRTKVVQMVLRGAFLQVGIGLAIGVPVAVAAGRLMGSQLYQVAGWDPAALSIAIALLAICALLAALVPAQRAAAIDPVKALRNQ